MPFTPSLVFSSLDLNSQLAVPRFVCRLLRLNFEEFYAPEAPAEPAPDWTWTEQDGDQARWEDPEESWGFDAPHQRLARLILQHILGIGEEDFHGKFVSGPDEIFKDCSGASQKLAPVQAQLRSVLQAFNDTQLLSEKVGQADAGETFLLPPEQASLVRAHLLRARPDLLTQSSDFKQFACVMLRRLSRQAGCIEIPITSEERVYLGNPETRAVTVKDNVSSAPLLDAEDPWARPEFAWGYHGAGPANLARSILVDATDGLTCWSERRPNQYSRDDLDFVNDFLEPPGPSADLKIQRSDVLTWLLARGLRTEELARLLVSSRRKHEALKPERERFLRVRNSPLMAQRFDLVPPDFECGIYLDLLNYIQRGGKVLICSRCGSAIADGTRGMSHRRSRQQKGLPVYHRHCFELHRQDAKREHARVWAARPEIKARRTQARRQI